MTGKFAGQSLFNMVWAGKFTRLQREGRTGERGREGRTGMGWGPGKVKKSVSPSFFSWKFVIGQSVEEAAFAHQNPVNSLVSAAAAERDGDGRGPGVKERSVNSLDSGGGGGGGRRTS